LWEKYASIEGDFLINKARQIGEIKINSASNLEEGYRVLYLENREQIEKLKVGDCLELQKKLGDLNACIIDGIQGIKEILIFQWQKIYFVRMYKANDDYNTAYYEYSKRSVREVSTFSLIIGISSVVSAIMIVYFARVGRYSYEMILPLISLSTMIYSPLRETLAMSSNYGRIFAAAKRVFDFMQLDATVSDEGNITYDDVIKEDKGEVYFNSVYFSYVDKDTGEKNSVLKGISFVIEKNQTTVLVGSSGSGKSTCSKLLQRFWIALGRFS